MSHAFYLRLASQLLPLLVDPEDRGSAIHPNAIEILPDFTQKHICDLIEVTP
jgi:hypothetical protein